MIFSILMGNFSAKTAGKTQSLTEPTEPTVVARSSAVLGMFWDTPIPGFWHSTTFTLYQYLQQDVRQFRNPLEQGHLSWEGSMGARAEIQWAVDLPASLLFL